MGSWHPHAEWLEPGTMPGLPPTAVCRLLDSGPLWLPRAHMETGDLGRGPESGLRVALG